MKDTISSFLSMQQALNTRRTQLNELRNSGTSRTYDIYADGTKKTVMEPTYELKKVDKMLVEINKALFLLDKRIKQANAKTNIDVDLDFDKLMSEIE